MHRDLLMLQAFGLRFSLAIAAVGLSHGYSDVYDVKIRQGSSRSRFEIKVQEQSLFNCMGNFLLTDPLK